MISVKHFHCVRFALNIQCPVCAVDTPAYASPLWLGGHSSRESDFQLKIRQVFYANAISQHLSFPSSTLPGNSIAGAFTDSWSSKTPKQNLGSAQMTKLDFLECLHSPSLGVLLWQGGDYSFWLADGQPGHRAAAALAMCSQQKSQAEKLDLSPRKQASLLLDCLCILLPLQDVARL